MSFVLLLHAVDEILLRNTDDVIHQPIDGQSGGKRHEHESKHQRHQHHHSLLIGVAGRWRHPLLQEHACTHENRQHWNARRQERRPASERKRQRLPIRPGEIFNPHERGMTELDRREQGIVETDEDGELKQHGQTTSHGIDFVAPIKLHDLLVHLFLIFFELLFNTLHLGLELLHPFHGDKALVSKRRNEELDQDRQQDDVDAVTYGEAVGKVQHVKKRNRNEPKVAKIDGSLQSLLHRLQGIELLGADEEDIAALISCLRC